MPRKSRKPRKSEQYDTLTNSLIEDLGRMKSGSDLNRTERLDESVIENYQTIDEKEKSLDAKQTSMLDLLHLPRPLKKSNLSEALIRRLFKKWRQFMFDRFKQGQMSQEAWKQVNDFWPESMNIQQQYHTLTLDKRSGTEDSRPALEREEGWIMNGHVKNPTPFITYLRKDPDLMNELRMCFKPVLTHRGHLEPMDVAELVFRYVYWLKQSDRSVNLMGVHDSYSQGYIMTTVEQMTQNLRDRWTDYRFHVALLNNNNQWTAILIDRKHRQFEMYDPLGRSIDLDDKRSHLSNQVLKLYRATRDLDQRITTLGTNPRKHSFRGASTTKCDLMALEFIHYRLILRYSFENFVQDKKRKSSCDELKKHFFTLKLHQEKKEKEEQKVSGRKYGEYDIRLAAFDLLRYVALVNQVATLPAANQTKLQELSNELKDLITKNGDYVFIYAKAVEVEKLIIASLSKEYQEYQGPDIWSRLVKQITTDPLTEQLRSMKHKIKGSGKKRASSTLRARVADRILMDLTGWRHNSFEDLFKTEDHKYEKVVKPSNRFRQVDAKTKEALDIFVRTWLDQWYIPILQFHADNKTKFVPGMGGESFLNETMKQQATTSYGVHFLRMVRAWVADNLPDPIETELDTVYKVDNNVIKPITRENFQQIVNYMNKCDEQIKKAYELLKNTFTEQVKSLSVMTQQKEQDLKHTDYSRVQTIIAGMMHDMKNSIKYGSAGFDPQTEMKPYYFPLNATNYQLTVRETLPPKWLDQSIDESEMRQLLSNESFRIYLGLEILYMKDAISRFSVEWFKRALMCLRQLFEASVPGYKSDICALADILSKTIKNERPEVWSSMGSIKDLVENWTQTCQAQGLAKLDENFHAKIVAEYKKLAGTQ